MSSSDSGAAYTPIIGSLPSPTSDGIDAGMRVVALAEHSPLLATATGPKV